MRLIDADALIQYMKDKWIPGNIDAIDAQPTIDAVPVVRCKDCINKPHKIKEYGNAWGFNLTARINNMNGYYCPFMCDDGWYSIIPSDDFYCKNGESRTDDDPSHPFADDVMMGEKT